MALQNNSQFNNFPESLDSQAEKLNEIDRANSNIGLSTERERAEYLVKGEIQRAIDSLPDTEVSIARVLENGLKAADNQPFSNTDDSISVVEGLVLVALANPTGIYDTVQKMRREGELYLLDKFHDGLVDKLAERQETLSSNN